MTKIEQRRITAGAIQSMYADEFINWRVEFKGMDGTSDWLLLELSSQDLTVGAQITPTEFSPYGFTLKKHNGEDEVILKHEANENAIHSLTKLLSFNTSHLSAEDCCKLVDLPIA